MERKGISPEIVQKLTAAKVVIIRQRLPVTSVERKATFNVIVHPQGGATAATSLVTLPEIAPSQQMIQLTPSVTDVTKQVTLPVTVQVLIKPAIPVERLGI